MPNTPTAHATTHRDVASTATRRLRLVLRANAATSSAGGVVALAAGAWLSRELGIDHVVLTRVIGAGLIAFALQVAFVSRAEDSTLLRDTPLISLADAAWVLGSVAVVASGALTTAGNPVVALVALAVADFAIGQVVLQRRATRATPQRVSPATS